MSSPIAHHRTTDGQNQPLADHLTGVAALTARHSAKLGLNEVGELLGLLHDLGKYSHAFQTYLNSATGQLDPDGDGWVDAGALKGKIDHSTAGAQWIWNRWGGVKEPYPLAAQIIALCVASHHSGLIDCLKSSGEPGFIERIGKADSKTHYTEAVAHADAAILERLQQLTTSTHLKAFLVRLQAITTNQPLRQRDFYLGLTTRFLFSALIDGDRQDSADFENPANRLQRPNQHPNWSTAIDRLETALAKWQDSTPIDTIRQQISANCRQRAMDAPGLYTLTVPTGGGKTLASLRFALHHAQAHQMDRVIYLIPYTSIIEQNATAIRAILEQEDDSWPWVLEHHSNLEPEQQSWHSKLASENWNAPIVLTTMVQFLETLFGGGTRSVRRLHQLANSVLIFDEIQTLPIKTVHLFCNALNYLIGHTHTTALLCTATQPLLNRLKNPEKGQLTLQPENELAGDVTELFRQLQRVQLLDQRRSKGWSCEDLVALALQQQAQAGSCLVIVNTKSWAKQLYRACYGQIEAEALFHLSTHQCPAHRKAQFATLRQRLDQGLPVLCISTQLIEAGVDIDFGSVVRFLAGLDSIAQAAGRCNRHGHRPHGQVILVNPAEEPMTQLIDIREGREAAARVLSEQESLHLLSPESMTRYFEYYFYRRADIMSYPVQNSSLLDLLSTNAKSSGYQESVKRLQQSFKSAADAFKAIDAPTEPLLVPWGEGKHLIAELSAVTKQFQPQRYRELLRAAQPYSVNLFANERRQLQEAGAIYEISAGDGLFYLDERHYSADFGVSREAVNGYEFLAI